MVRDMQPTPPPSQYPPGEATAGNAIQYLSGDQGNEVSSRVQELVAEFGIDAVRQALDECEMGDDLGSEGME